MDFSYQGFSVGSGTFNYNVAGATNLGSLSSYNNYNLIDQFYMQNALGDKVINNATAVEIYDLNATDTGINDFDIDQAMEYLKNNLSEEDFYRLFHSFQFFDFDSLSEEDQGNLLNYWVDCLETNNFIELNGTDFPILLRKTNNDVSTPNVSNSNSDNVDNIPLEPVTATIYTVINGAVSVGMGIASALESLLDFTELVTAGIGMTLAGGVADLLDLASYGSEWESFKWTKELLSGLLEYIGIDHVGECVSEWYDAGGFWTTADAEAYLKINSLFMKGIKKISKYATQVILAWLTGGLIESAAAAGIIDEGSSLLVAGSHAFTLITSFMTYADAFPETYEMLIEIETSANFDNALKEYSSNNSGTSLSKILTEEIELMKNDSEYAGEPISLEDAAEHFYERLELELETQAEKEAKNNGRLIVEAFAVASVEAAINAIFVEASSYYSELATANLEHAFTKDYVLENAKKVLFTAIIKQGRTFMNEMITSCIDGDLTIEDALSALDTYFQSIAGEIIGQYVKSDAEAFLQKYGFISIEKLERYMRMRHSTGSENNSSEENFSFDINSNPDYGAANVDLKSSESIDLLYKDIYAGMKEMGIAPEKLTGKAATEYLKLLCPYIEKIVQIPANATEEEVDEFYLNLLKAIFEYNEAA